MRRPLKQAAILLRVRQAALIAIVPIVRRAVAVESSATIGETNSFYLSLHSLINFFLFLEIRNLATTTRTEVAIRLATAPPQLLLARSSATMSATTDRHRQLAIASRRTAAVATSNLGKATIVLGVVASPDPLQLRLKDHPIRASASKARRSYKVTLLRNSGHPSARDGFTTNTLN